MIAYIGQVQEEMARDSLLKIDIPLKSLRPLEIWIQRTGRALTFREDAVMHYRLRSDLRGVARQQYRYGRTEALLRRKFGGETASPRWRDQWPMYRYLLTRSWHLLADPYRRGAWVSKAAYRAGRIAGALKYRVVHF